jgi:ornithine cyclodeaminase/alanine dehydrogenase-like protein (mu-crystallin family)
MKVLVLTQGEIERLMPVGACIPVMAQALEALARGDVHQPLRWVIRPPNAVGLIGLMPAVLSGAGRKPAYGLKVVCLFKDNPALGKDMHQGSVMLFDGETGELVALMNASAITAIRTAAVSGLATRLLARDDAGDLAIIGAGVQARTHLLAMAVVRRLRRVRVASRNIERARALAREMRLHVSCEIEPVASASDAIRGADLVVTATSSVEPVLERSWISPGAHLNVVGSSLPSAREIDTATMAAASLFVDRRESTLSEAGDYLFAAAEGAIGPDHIRAELGELLTGERTGRRAPEEITLFKSLGLAVEDLAAAEFLHQRAQEAGVGTWVDF